MSENNSAAQKVITFTYQLKFDEGQDQAFTINLDYDTLNLLLPSREVLPDWTALTFHQCPNCPLEESSHPRCPVAVSLVDLFDFFKDFASYDEAEVWVRAMERTYYKRASLQDIAGALMGIYMVSSGCPILSKMRPMVIFHLPFQSWREAFYRFIAMYLFIQFILARNGKNPDWQLANFAEFYDAVEIVNQGFSERISFIEVMDGDVSINAVNLLNATGGTASMILADEDLQFWTKLILEHWDRKP